MLRFIGDGSQWFNGVPARDLTAEEAAQYPVAELVASGLYVVDGETTTSAPESGAIDLRDGVSESEASLAGKALARKRKETS
jgi:hypothetical protein